MHKLAASFIFFTRLPLWRWVKVDASYYSRVVECWPAVGWLTGCFTAGVLWLLALMLPPLVAVAGAFAARVLLTGAMHEDGLADFFDGFGGGTTRERILAIMKDSHIGTYGVLGLLFYFLILVGAVSSLPVNMACLAIIIGDPWCKFCSSQIINILPYCRTAETAKNRTVYARMSPRALLVDVVLGNVPLLAVCLIQGVAPHDFSISAVFSCLAAGIVAMALFMLMRHKIGGYTGDCCGATFLLSELSFYLTLLSLITLYL